MPHPVHSTTSPLPLHAYFIKSERWPEGKKPWLLLASTIAFGGFIDKIWWDWTIDKAILSMEIKITNITYISNWPETSPHYNHTQQTITIPQNLTHEQHHLKHDGIITNPTKNDPSKKTPHPHHSNTLQKQWATKKKQHTAHSLNDDHQTPSNKHKKEWNNGLYFLTCAICISIDRKCKLILYSFLCH